MRWYVRETSKSCQRHFGTTSNTSALNQSIVGGGGGLGRPDSVQVDSPLRQRAHAYVSMGRILWWAHKVPQKCLKAAYTRICAHGNLLTNRPRSVDRPLDLVRPPRDHRRPSHRHPKGLYIFGPEGFRYEITAALMDSEVATISMKRNNVTLIYLRFNPTGHSSRYAPWMRM